MPLLIPDGCTRDETIPTADGLPAVRVRFRPALPEAYNEFLYPRPSGKEVEKATLALLTEHLVSWDVRDKKGNLVPLDEAALRRVPWKVRNQMVNLVLSYVGEEQAKSEGNSGAASASS
jgi:hypothetical protein